MGITIPKSLRYPEATTEARTLHTRIKELADDVNGVLVDHDTRFSKLDTKTNTTNSNLSLRGNAAWPYGKSAGVYTHSPNDGINRTISEHPSQFYVHSSANYIQVSMMQSSYCGGVGGAAGVWEPLVNFGGTGWQYLTGVTLRVHNQENNVLDMGFHVVGIFNAQPYRGMAGSVATNFNNDATSAGWVVHGNLLWNAVSFT